MDAQEIIRYIAESEKKTPVRIYLKEKEGAKLDFGSARVFGAGDKIIFGDWKELKPVLEENAAMIEDCIVEYDRRNSGVPMLEGSSCRAGFTVPASLCGPAPQGHLVTGFQGGPRPAAGRLPSGEIGRAHV